MKGIQTRKEKVKASLLVDVTYIENHKESTKHFALINELSKDAGYKINRQKSIIVVHTSNGTSVKEIKKILFITASKTTK